MVNKVMLKHRINHQRYDILICRIVKVRLDLTHIFHLVLWTFQIFFQTFWANSSNLPLVQTELNIIIQIAQAINKSWIKNTFYLKSNINKSLLFITCFQHLSLEKETLLCSQSTFWDLTWPVCGLCVWPVCMCHNRATLWRRRKRIL